MFATALLACGLQCAGVVADDLPGTDPAKLATTMEEARQSFSSGDLDRAIALYTRVSEQKSSPLRADALEFLGVTRQRKGQLAHAKFVYDQYLKEYPNGDGHKRVKQRLAAITEPPRSKSNRQARAASKPGNSGTRDWEYFGSHSNYFRSNTVSIDDNDSINNLSMWQGNVDFIARTRGEKIAFVSRLAGGYSEDFTDVGRNKSGVNLSKAYVNVTALKFGIDARIGRQSKSSGGVYGTFDGVRAGWEFKENATVNLVAGYPVRRRNSSFESDRSMYGASVEFEGISDSWNFGVFANSHTVDGIADRRGIGGEFRYYDATKNVYGIVDYDALYSSVNATLLGFNWIAQGRRINVYGTLDYRRSPLLSTTNAVIGQGVTSLNELSVGLTEAELQALAEDNTATSSSATIGVSLPLTERFQINTSLHVNKLDTAVSFMTLNGVNPSASTLSLNTQLVASSWWRQGDAWIMGLRLADSNTFQTSTITLNTRVPVSKRLRVNPLLRVMYRQNKVSDTKEWIITPGLRLSWCVRRFFVLEFDAHQETAQRTTRFGDSDRSSIYYSIGYRADFGR